MLPVSSGHGLSDICCFFTLTHTEIKRENLPKSAASKLPRYPVPVLLIAQLAVNKAMQNKGFGKITLIRALKQFLAINQHLPSVAIVVDALDEEVVNFYTHFGFEALTVEAIRTRLFIPMSEVEQLFADLG